MKYNNFLAYTAIENKYDRNLAILLLKCVAFYRSSVNIPENTYVKDIYLFCEWLTNSSATEQTWESYIKEGTEKADDAQHVAHKAVEIFKTTTTRESDWSLDYTQYMLFNSICNELEHMSLRIAIADYRDRNY